MGRCDKCGESLTDNQHTADFGPGAKHTCQGDAAWKCAVACGKELFPGHPWTDAEIAVIAWKMRAFVREQVFEMGDAETKRLLGEVAHGSFADRGRAAAKAALNQAQLIITIERAQAVVAWVTKYQGWTSSSGARTIILPTDFTRLIDALAALLPMK